VDFGLHRVRVMALGGWIALLNKELLAQYSYALEAYLLIILCTVVVLDAG
jgi:hypothetical protein